MGITQETEGRSRIETLDPAFISLLSAQGLAVLTRGMQNHQGTVTDVLRELEGALRSAAHYESLIISAARREIPALEQLREFPHSFPSGGFTGAGWCPVAPLSPLFFLWAGVHIAGSFDAELNARQLWGTYRSMLEQVAVRLDDIRQAITPDRFAGSPDLTEFGFPIGGFGPPWPKQPVLCFTEEEFCLGELAAILREAGRFPQPSIPSIGSITPADLCVQSGPTQVIVRPAAGTSFPGLQSDLNPGRGGSISLAVDGRPAKVVRWSSSMIVIELAGGFPAGCHEIGWRLDPDRALDQLESLAGECGRYGAQTPAGLSRWIVFPQGELTIIGAPRIVTFAASKPNAEACEPVELSWSVILPVCRTSQATVHVSLFEDGTIVQDYLPLVGTATVDRETNASYMLRAVSMIGAQQCTTGQASLTVSRTAVLRVAGPSDICLGRNARVSIDITSSCPAPPGGLRIDVLSSDNSRFPRGVSFIDEGQTSVNFLLTSGSICGDVTLTFAAVGHTSASLTFHVADVPSIAALSPANFVTCQPIDFVISGSCLGDTRTGVSVRLERGGTRVAARAVTVLTPDQELRTSFDPLPAGTYVVIVESCGGAGAASVPVVVSQATPSVVQIGAIPSAADLCDSSAVRLRWSVRDASTVEIRTGGQIVFTRMGGNSCDLWEDEVTVNPGLGQTIYELSASVAGTTATGTATATFTRTSAITTISSFVLSNLSGRTLVLWALAGGSGSLLGPLGSGQTYPLQLMQCIPLIIVAVDPALVDDHNQRFKDTLQTSQLGVAQNPRFRRWGSITFRFHPSGPATSATIV